MTFPTLPATGSDPPRDYTLVAMSHMSCKLTLNRSYSAAADSRQANVPTLPATLSDMPPLTLRDTWNISIPDVQRMLEGPSWLLTVVLSSAEGYIVQRCSVVQGCITRTLPAPSTVMYCMCSLNVGDILGNASGSRSACKPTEPSHTATMGVRILSCPDSPATEAEAASADVAPCWPCPAGGWGLFTRFRKSSETSYIKHRANVGSCRIPHVTLIHTLQDTYQPHQHKNLINS